MDLRLDDVTRQFTIGFRVTSVSGLYPYALLPTLRLAETLRSPNRVTVAVSSRDLWTPQPLPEFQLVPPEYVQLVANLARIQLETNSTFPMPDEISADDAATVRMLIRLLDGEAVPVRLGPIVIRVPAGAGPPDTDHNTAYINTDDDVELMGEHIRIGMCHVSTGQWRVDETYDGPPGEFRLMPLDARGELRRGGHSAG